MHFDMGQPGRAFTFDRSFRTIAPLDQWFPIGYRKLPVTDRYEVFRSNVHGYVKALVSSQQPDGYIMPGTAAALNGTIQPMRVRHGWVQAVTAGLIAGIATGFIVLVPVLVLQEARGIGVVPEMQLAAASLMGLAAYAGMTGLILGTVLHFFVSIVTAVAYALVAWRVPLVRRWAWIDGPILGLIVFFFMGLVVLPHTAFATPASVSPIPFVGGLLIHMFGFGLPIALIVQRLWARSENPEA
ncbi:hypothetical protein [Lichenicola sp.]|uniref:hypothetical protein n=1 Tax=Lichenicola sp. TaxID=2804529 RepID=UPI003AFF682C